MSFYEKIVIILLLIILIMVNAFIFFIVNNNFIKDGKLTFNNENRKSDVENVINDINSGEYEVYQNDRLIKTFYSYESAVEYAENYENASVKRLGGSWLWDNTPIYNVYKEQSDDFKAFAEFKDALNYAKSIGNSAIYYRYSKSFIWNNYEPRSTYHLIEDVPRIEQNPELNRGCEVTSLAMLLNYKGISVDKMTLAQNIIKDNSVKTEKDGKIYYGNPNSGFVGDIYDINKDGLGVYHGPIYELLSTYLGGEAVDITGCEREDIMFYIGKNRPVWIITNTKFKPLPPSDFVSWESAEGPVYTTYSEHSVLVIGYDNDYVYFNDPLDASSVKKENKDNFFDAWEQMGRQAVTYCPT